jgi:peptidyl-prolyl cis-trans isomerase C
MSVAGCGDRQPEGQTAAVVNGQPITETALRMEIAASENQVTREQALNALIERSLIIEQAKKQKLDQRPQFTLEKARMSDVLLVRQYAQMLSQSSGSSVSSMDVEAYLAEHPEIGSGRRQITLKQVIFPEPKDSNLKSGIAAAKSYPELIQVLQARQVKFEEGSTTIDTAVAPAPIMKAMRAAQPGEPFVVIGKGQALASAVEKEVAIPTSSEQQLALARARMMQSSVESKLGQMMQAWKKGADIKYSQAPKKAASTDSGVDK